MYYPRGYYSSLTMSGKLRVVMRDWRRAAALFLPSRETEKKKLSRKLQRGGRDVVVGERFHGGNK